MGDTEKKLIEAMEALNEGSYQNSFDIFKPLAEHGDPKAQFYLGFLY
jgi:TPR repeat protein